MIKVGNMKKVILSPNHAFTKIPQPCRIAKVEKDEQVKRKKERDAEIDKLHASDNNEALLRLTMSSKNARRESQNTDAKPTSRSTNDDDGYKSQSRHRKKYYSPDRSRSPSPRRQRRRSRSRDRETKSRKRSRSRSSDRRRSRGHKSRRRSPTRSRSRGR